MPEAPIAAASSSMEGLVTGERDRTTRCRRTRLERAMRVEWLGQTAASLFWMVSVFSYGLSSTGDWLQLSAASAWLLANTAAILTSEVS